MTAPFSIEPIERIVEIEGGAFSEYAGKYDFYLEEKARRMEVRVATYRNQQDRIRQIERFIDRNRYDKKTAGTGAKPHKDAGKNG